MTLPNLLTTEYEGLHMYCGSDLHAFLHIIVRQVICVLFITCAAGGIGKITIPPSDSSGLFSEGPTSLVTSRPYVLTQDFGPLSPGEIVKRKVARAETQIFHVTLAEGQFLRVIVEQQGVDVELQIFGPMNLQAGQQSVKIDSPNGLYGPESVSIVSKFSGNYSIRVRCDNSIPDGGYELRTEGPRELTASDQDRITAENLFAKGQELRFEGTQTSLRQAVEYYTGAQRLWESLGDAHGQAYAACNIGRSYSGLRDISDAIRKLSEASSILRESRDGPGEAWMLNEIAAIHRTMGDSSQAIELYKRSFQLRLSGGDLWGQAQILNNLGLAYANMGLHQQAVENYQQAIPLWRNLHDLLSELNTLNNLYLSSSELGDASALENFHQLNNACQAMADCKDKYLEGYIHNNTGKILDTLAESEAALNEYQSAIAIFHQRARKEDEAMVLDNIGMVYAGLGDGEQALKFFFQALEIRSKLFSPRGSGITNTNIGYAYIIQGEPKEALKYFDRALPLNREARNMPFVAYTLVSKGMAHASIGMPQTALDLYGQALSIWTELGDMRGQAIALEKIGQVYAGTGAIPRALDNYMKSLKHWRTVKDRQGQALTLYDIARAERDIQDLEGARIHVEEAIEIIESLRTKLTGDRLRLNYFATKQDFYELDIDVRMHLFDLTRLEEHREVALYASERARARSLLELLAEARADIRTETPQRVGDRTNSLEWEISALTQKLIGARNLRAEKEVAALESRIETTTREFDELQATIRTHNRSYAGLKHPEPLKLEQIQKLLDDDSLLLEYSLGERQSYLWAVTRTTIESYKLPARTRVEEAVISLRTLLTVYEPHREDESVNNYWKRLRNSESQYWDKSAEAGRMLLGPAISHLHLRRMIIVADGALLYLPFEALVSPQMRIAASRYRMRASITDPELLAANHEIVYEPSATTLGMLRDTPRKVTNGTVAVIADPVYNMEDERVNINRRKTPTVSITSVYMQELNRTLRDVGDIGTAGEAFKLSRLRHSAEEAEGIVAAAPGGSWMMAVGFEANRDIALSQQLERYSIVHFAAHGFFDEKRPERSGIVLSMIDEIGKPRNGFLRMGDVYNMNLSADLVVLSACRTGLGENVKGEGLIGLTRGFMHAGAKLVLASLWKVDDEATAELMKRFYYHMLKERLPAVSALKLAKKEMMQAREQWRAPYYWAGFILQGDWK